ncbi:PLAC8-domain-containing protein [Byssothecium circinans]|uniref:PLAC8-domain-containing protein n=1 Tax=Byssothecium circinans TaxID=147558 RepID=A0A6A5TFX8_9PLEO|nr:PLAC8-domain-containing protein [Byssothecium circinans]
MSQNTQDWHHSGSGCCSPFGTCCMGWWCPCILHGKTRHRTKNNGNMSGYSCCNGSCMGFCGLAMLGVGFVLPWISRSDIRQKYSLTGNGCKDCMCACCCAPCDVIQQAKEVEYREESKHLLHTQPGKVDGMHYQQQNPQYNPHGGYGHKH